MGGWGWRRVGISVVEVAFVITVAGKNGSGPLRSVRLVGGWTMVVFDFARFSRPVKIGRILSYAIALWKPVSTPIFCPFFDLKDMRNVRKSLLESIEGPERSNVEHLCYTYVLAKIGIRNKLISPNVAQFLGPNQQWFVKLKNEHHFLKKTLKGLKKQLDFILIEERE